MRKRSGYYEAVIGNLEISLSPIGYKPVVRNAVSESDCDYDGCAKHDTQDECIRLHGKCPLEIKKRRRVLDDLVSGLSGWEEVEAVIREKIRYPRRPFPAEARQLSTDEWEFSEARTRSACVERVR